MEGNSNLMELLKKIARNQKLKIVHGEEQLKTILDQLNASDDLQVNNQLTLEYLILFLISFLKNQGIK